MAAEEARLKSSKIERKSSKLNALRLAELVLVLPPVWLYRSSKEALIFLKGGSWDLGVNKM